MSCEGTQVIELPSHFSQVQLAGLKDVIDHHCENGHPIRFDASALDRIDGAAVQFLLAVSNMQSAANNSDALVINTNEVLNKALKDMGMSDLIKTDSGDTEGSGVAYAG